jgi:FixJ family two-component response regulator
MVERCGSMLPADADQSTTSDLEERDTQLDVASVLADLPEFERQVGQMLSAGHTATSIARELGIDRRAVRDAVDVIRDRFASAGFGGEELA